MFTCSVSAISNGLTFIVDVNFGDGSPIQKFTLADSSVTFQHSYSSVNFFILTATVENSNLYVNPLITSKLIFL